MELDIAAEIGIATDKLSQSFKDSKPRRPYHIRRVTSGVAVAGTPTVLSFGSPPVGMEWNVRQLIVVGSDDRTVLVGTDVAAYIGDPASPSLSMLLEPSVGSTVPNSVNYGTENIWVQSEAELFLIVYGATAGQSLVGLAFLDAVIVSEA